MCALVIAGIDDGPARQAHLTFAKARHVADELAQVFISSPLAWEPDRLPPSSLKALRNALAEAGLTVREGLATDQKLLELRQMYEPYVQALSKHLLISLPPWFRLNFTLDSWQISNWLAPIPAMATDSPAIQAAKSFGDGHYPERNVADIAGVCIRPTSDNSCVKGH